MDFLLSSYLNELLAVTSITLLTIITPGPDFVIVARNSLSYSQRSGVFTSIGVAVAVWIHVVYTLAGIGLLLSKSILLFSLIKLMGAAYLVYLGVSCIRNKDQLDTSSFTGKVMSVTDFQSFRMGFINNALNPKATLFFLSLFTQLVSPATPLAIQVLYGAIVSFSCLIWFSLVAVFLNKTGVKSVFVKVQTYVEKVMGAVLLCFGVKVALSSAN